VDLPNCPTVLGTGSLPHQYLDLAGRALRTSDGCWLEGERRASPGVLSRRRTWVVLHGASLVPAKPDASRSSGAGLTRLGSTVLTVGIRTDRAGETGRNGLILQQLDHDRA